MSGEFRLRSTGDGTVLAVHVVPRAGRTELDGIHDGALRVRVKAPPVDGAANKALCAFLSKMIGVPKRQVAVTGGERGRTKSVHVIGVSPADVRHALADEIE